MKGIEALCYLDDIAHGRKMEYDAHDLKLVVEKELKALEIIRKNSFLVAGNHGERIIISIFDHFTPENIYLLIKEVLIHDKSDSTK